MKTFSVKNFERFQHYKDRSPPWIKLYNELLDDYNFGLLPDASKFHLIAIWLLASRSENKIPYDSTWVARRINASEGVDLDTLARLGFIVVDQELQIAERIASGALAERLSREEGEREGEKRQNAAAPAAPPKVSPIPSAESDYYRRVKEIAGPNSGGLAKKLLDAKGGNIPLARAAAEQASTKADPREYLGAIIRNRDGPSDAEARGRAW